MTDFFVRPIENTLEAWDRLLQRQIAERYGVPVSQVSIVRDCAGGISIHVDTTDWKNDVPCHITIIKPVA